MMMIKPTSSRLPLRNQTPPPSHPPLDLSWNALQRYTIVGKCQTFISYTTSSLPIGKLAKSCTWALYGIWESGNFHLGIYTDRTWLREHPAINVTFIKGMLLNFLLRWWQEDVDPALGRCCLLVTNGSCDVEWKLGTRTPFFWTPLHLKMKCYASKGMKIKNPQSSAR